MSEKESKREALLSAFDRMLDSMMEFDSAMQNLWHEDWINVVDGYPFNKDFAKIILDMCDWEDKVHENFAA